MTADEHFLSRWSRRKEDERERAQKPAIEVDEAADAAESGEQPAEIAPEDLPDIDTLHKDSDFTVFMREGVPEELKLRALRKLWTSDPVLANVDGLNDYDGDYGTLLEKGAEAMRRFAASGDLTGRPAAVTAAEEIDAGPAEAPPEQVASAQEDAGDAAAESDASAPDGEAAENSPGDSKELPDEPRTGRG
jgi:hypothetical protein